MLDNLDKVGQALQSNAHIILDKVTLAYGQEAGNVLLETSLEAFLTSGGQRISVLRIETAPKHTQWTLNDLYLISQYCPLLDTLEISGTMNRTELELKDYFWGNCSNFSYCKEYTKF